MEIRHPVFLLVFLLIGCITSLGFGQPPFKMARPKPPPLYKPASSYSAIGGGCFCNDTVCIYEAMKTDLYDSNTADLLQLAFFTNIPFFDSVRVTTSVNFTVYDVKNNSNTMMTWIHQWFPYTPIGVLRKVFPAVIRGAIDPWSALPVFYEVYNNEYFIPVSLTISLNCTRTHAGQSVSNDVDIMNQVKSLWGENMQWAKSYARYNGPVPYSFDDDRGIAYDVTTFSSTDVLAFALFCSMYILFNIVVATAVISGSSHAFTLLMNKYNETKYVKSLYWSVASIGAIYIALYIVAKVLIISFRSRAISQIPQDFVAQLLPVFEVMSFIVPFVLVALHFFKAMHVSGHVNSYRICDTQKIRGCRVGWSQRMIWTCSLWFVMGCVQLIATSTIPIVISLLTDSFRSLAMFSVLATCIICASVALAVVIHICESGPKHTKWIIFMLLVLSGVGFLLITAFAAYFLVLTEEGLDANTIAGYIFSLVPTLILAAIAYVADNYLLGNEDSNANESGKTKSNEKVAKKKSETNTSKCDLLELSSLKSD